MPDANLKAPTALAHTPLEKQSRSWGLLWLIPVLLLPVLVWWLAQRGETPTAPAAPAEREAVSEPLANLPAAAPASGGGVFGAWDRDGDDRLGRGEFASAWASVGWQDAAPAFTAFDMNRDGAVEEKEFFGRLYR